MSAPKCAECKRLHGLYWDATVQYVDFYDKTGLAGEARDEGDRLHSLWINTMRAFYGHKGGHKTKSPMPGG